MWSTDKIKSSLLETTLKNQEFSLKEFKSETPLKKIKSLRKKEHIIVVMICSEEEVDKDIMLRSVRLIEVMNISACKTMFL